MSGLNPEEVPISKKCEVPCLDRARVAIFIHSLS